jgi:hypothetical protein
MKYIMNDLVDLPPGIRLTRCYDNVLTYRHYTRNLTPINYAPHLAETVVVRGNTPQK